MILTATDIEDRKQAEQRLQNENVALREEIDKASMFEEIVGISPALHTVLSRVSKVAPTDSTVLITGETGTGKELIARAVHKRSQRNTEYRGLLRVALESRPRSLLKTVARERRHICKSREEFSRQSAPLTVCSNSPLARPCRSS
jgi:transcriptional regulator with GAF, ATPase, and Fis domain